MWIGRNTRLRRIFTSRWSSRANNVEALTGLASVLYREDKDRESTTILDRLPRIEGFGGVLRACERL